MGRIKLKVKSIFLSQKQAQRDLKLKRRKERLENEKKYIDRKPSKDDLKKDKVEEKDEN